MRWMGLLKDTLLAGNFVADVDLIKLNQGKYFPQGMPIFYYFAINTLRVVQDLSIALCGVIILNWCSEWLSEWVKMGRSSSTTYPIIIIIHLGAVLKTMPLLSEFLLVMRAVVCLDKWERNRFKIDGWWNSGCPETFPQIISRAAAQERICRNLLSTRCGIRSTTKQPRNYSWLLCCSLCVTKSWTRWVFEIFGSPTQLFCKIKECW